MGKNPIWRHISEWMTYLLTVVDKAALFWKNFPHVNLEFFLVVTWKVYINAANANVFVKFKLTKRKVEQNAEFLIKLEVRSVQINEFHIFIEVKYVVDFAVQFAR